MPYLHDTVCNQLYRYTGAIHRVYGRSLYTVLYILHTLTMQPNNPTFEQLPDVVTSASRQEITITALEDGVMFALAGGEPHKMVLEGCAFPWRQIARLEFGGDCKASWGNWRNILIEKN